MAYVSFIHVSLSLSLSLSLSFPVTHSEWNCKFCVGASLKCILCLLVRDTIHSCRWYDEWVSFVLHIYSSFMFTRSWHHSFLQVIRRMRLHVPRMRIVASQMRIDVTRSRTDVSRTRLDVPRMSLMECTPKKKFYQTYTFYHFKQILEKKLVGKTQKEHNLEVGAVLCCDTACILWYIYIVWYVSAYIYMYVYVCICIHIHIHIHTHIWSRYIACALWYTHVMCKCIYTHLYICI